MYIYLHSVLYTAYIEIKYMYKLYSVFLTYFMENLSGALSFRIYTQLVRIFMFPLPFLQCTFSILMERFG